MGDQIQPWPVLRRGSREHPVPTLQYLLRDRGHAVTVDGIFGPKTEVAVADFQHADQLKVDGVVGPKTWGALVIVVASGSTGDAVRGVQEEFRFRDLSGEAGRALVVDGVFGPRTMAVVLGFQRALGLNGDGIVGPATWRALVSGMLSL
jgi:peptidoglycan hydrolase-like protein with peptidoglycan-binding domain